MEFDDTVTGPVMARAVVLSGCHLIEDDFFGDGDFDGAGPSKQRLPAITVHCALAVEGITPTIIATKANANLAPPMALEENVLRVLKSLASVANWNFDTA